MKEQFHRPTHTEGMLAWMRTVLHRFMSLNIWSPVGGIDWEKLWDLWDVQAYWRACVTGGRL